MYIGLSDLQNNVRGVLGMHFSVEVFEKLVSPIIDADSTALGEETISFWVYAANSEEVSLSFDKPIFTSAQASLNSDLMTQKSFDMLINDLFVTETTMLEDPDDSQATIYGYS